MRIGLLVHPLTFISLVSRYVSMDTITVLLTSYAVSQRLLQMPMNE